MTPLIRKISDYLYFNLQMRGLKRFDPIIELGRIKVSTHLIVSKKVYRETQRPTREQLRNDTN